ncbi:MAG: nicotinate-nucleotide adenylyltransferase [Saprospiraceae bacterium]|nr:nicotinate-nucleotide adenylyltransferase [Saprospiraceae bacterium]
MKVGLFFGSFNPVHTGHMIIANQIVHLTGLDQVWMVVSPHNPLKKKSTLANDFDRLHLVNLAIGENTRIKASNIEFNLPKPSYTVDTLTYLLEKYPDYQFVLIMGADNLETLHKWKNYEKILQNHEIYVYLRPGSNAQITFDNHHITILQQFPLLDISSTYVRECLQKGISIQYLVPDAVFEYLDGSTMYR